MKRRKPRPELGFDQLLLQIKPYRYYEASLVHGQPALVLKVARLSDPVKLLSGPGDVISSEEIHALMRLSKLPLIDPDITDLVDDLNLIRVTVHPKQALPDGFEDPVAGLDAKLKAAVDLIPIADAHLKASIGAFPKGVGRPKRERIVHSLSQLQMAIEETRQLLTIPVATNHSAYWHDDAFYIGWHVQRLADTQGIPISITKPSSSGVDFICQVLERAHVPMTSSSGKILGDPHQAVAKAVDRCEKQFIIDCRALRDQIKTTQDR